MNADEISYWDYRVINRDGDYSIYEVFYDENDTPRACTENPVTFHGVCLFELDKALHLALEGLRKPVLQYDDFLKDKKK